MSPFMSYFFSSIYIYMCHLHPILPSLRFVRLIMQPFPPNPRPSFTFHTLLRLPASGVCLSRPTSRPRSNPFPSPSLLSNRTVISRLSLPPFFLGAILSEPISDPQKPQITGSVMLAVAESKEEVVRQLKEDIYFKSGVWDWDRVQVYPVSNDPFSCPMCFCLGGLGVWGGGE